MKRFKIIGVVLFLILLGSGIYYFSTNLEKSSNLTLAERQWIDENKNSVIDIAVLNGVPLFTYSTEGIFFEYIRVIEEELELAFNLVPYSYNAEMEENYQFKLKRELENNDLLFYTDNFVLLMAQKSDVSLADLTIGIVADDEEIIVDYYGEEFNFEKYNNYQDLLADLRMVEEEVVDEEEETELDIIAIEDDKIDAVIVPKLLVINKIIEKDLQIMIDLFDIKIYYVLQKNGDNNLNSIFAKSFEKWALDNYNRKFNENFNRIYYSKNNVNEKEQADFLGKRYRYGFVKNPLYNFLENEKLIGINKEFIRAFIDRTGIEVRYKEYDTYSDLVADFNNDEIDFFVNNGSFNYEVEIAKSSFLYKNNYVIVSNIFNTEPITSLNALHAHEVVIFPDERLKILLDNNQVDYQVINFGNISLNDEQIVIIDERLFNFYRVKYFANYKVDYRLSEKLENMFVFNANNENRVLIDYLSFFLVYVNKAELVNEGYANSHEANFRVDYRFFASLVLSGLAIILAIFSLNYFWLNKKRQHQKLLTKDNKLKYIDFLTSLKNRNYLNDNIEKWDESEVYPQGIVIVDLNNVAYINDNYGHAEGDNLIKEAANILILNQEENSEIIRTSGNEFLIYLVGYDAKQIDAYCKKLHKELKNLSHGFGATVGCSMIEDGIKTVDDAINEATIDMRNKKVLD